MIASKKSDQFVGIIIVWAILVIVLISRLVAIQIFSVDLYKNLAKVQQLRKKPAPAPRGNIFDRNGIPLAINNLFYDIHADPTCIIDTNYVDSVLCRIFRKPIGFYGEKINTGQKKYFVYIERTVSPELGLEVKESQLPGIFVIPKFNRIYPQGKVGSSVIGFVGTDGKGLEGLELYYDEKLSGKSSERIIVIDAIGRTYPLPENTKEPTFPGNDLYTTIDIRLQELVERELEQVVEKNKADAATAIFLDPLTGEILSKASFPNYDPNKPNEYPEDHRRNRAVTDVFEPGSMFKIVTMSAALTENKIELGDTIDAGLGICQFDSREVEDVKPMGLITAAEVLIYSSNIGIVKIAQKLTKKTLYKYAKRFGFGTITNIDFPGEMDGVLRPPEKWSATTMLTLPMGYEISSTALQLLRAYGVIANHGKLMQPFIVEEIVSFDNQVVLRREPILVRQVIPDFVADSILSVLGEVVNRGTGRAAKSPFIKIAGKTGTTHKFSEDNRRYDKNKYYSSFLGIAPAEDPYIIGIVVVDNPKAGRHYGGSVAAPVFRSIIEKAISAGIFASSRSQKLTIKSNNEYEIHVPDIKNMNPNQALSILNERGLIGRLSGVGEFIVAQLPSPGTKLQSKDTVTIYLGNNTISTLDSVLVPNLTNLSVRTAIKKLTEIGLDFELTGYGKIREQFPEPYIQVPKNLKVKLKCQDKEL